MSRIVIAKRCQEITRRLDTICGRPVKHVLTRGDDVQHTCGFHRDLYEKQGYTRSRYVQPRIVVLPKRFLPKPLPPETNDADVTAELARHQGSHALESCVECRLIAWLKGAA